MWKGNSCGCGSGLHTRRRTQELFVARRWALPALPCLQVPAGIARSSFLLVTQSIKNMETRDVAPNPWMPYSLMGSSAMCRVPSYYNEQGKLGDWRSDSQKPAEPEGA